MVGFLLYLSIAWGVRGVVRLHRILSNIVLIWRLRAGKWFDKGSRCGCLLSNPSLLLKFTAQPTDLLPRGGGCTCVHLHTPEKVGWGGCRKHLDHEEPLICLCLSLAERNWKTGEENHYGNPEHNRLNAA